MDNYDGVLVVRGTRQLIIYLLIKVDIGAPAHRLVLAIVLILLSVLQTVQIFEGLDFGKI